MRISITTPDNKRFHLAGQPGVSERVHSSAANYQKSVIYTPQVSRFVRARAVKVHDRGNQQTVISFGTSRKFEDAAEAMAWGHDHEIDYPRAGTVAVESQRANGGTLVRYLKDAAVSPPEIQFLGATLLIYYTITGGIFTRS